MGRSERRRNTYRDTMTIAGFVFSLYKLWTTNVAGAHKARISRHANVYNGLPNRIDDSGMHMLSAKAPYSSSVPIPCILGFPVLAECFQFNEFAKRVPTFISTVVANLEKPSCLHIFSSPVKLKLSTR